MSRQQEVFTLIARLGGSKNKIVVERTLCQYMGSLEGGVFLSQLLYWCDKGSGEWFYKSHKEWHAETFLSEYQVRQASKRSIELGFLETKLKKANGAPTVHYRLDTEKFMDSILKFLSIETEIFKNGNSNNEECILKKPHKPVTEITTETTTEITTDIISSQGAKATPQQEMFAAVCEAIGTDPNTLTKEDKGQIAQAVGILAKANYTVDDIRRFMVECWFKDWRWEKNGALPTLKQLRNEIGKIRSVVPSIAPPVKSTNNGVNAIMDYMERTGMRK
jgi:hypothetical protein